MKKILWIAPNLNHYKARFLKKLQEKAKIDITVFAGAGSPTLGHRIQRNEVTGLKVIRTSSDKAGFQKSPPVYIALCQIIGRYRPDLVLMPCEKKHVFLIGFLSILRMVFGFFLVTYTHPVMRSEGLKHKRINRFMTKIMFKMYDRVIFYTEPAMSKALEESLLPLSKAAYANNTLDTDSIKAVYRFTPPPEQPQILFIGRLIPNKRIDLVIKYYEELKKRLPELKLVVVGDGPEAPSIREVAQKDKDIDWKGAIVDERQIAGIMRHTQLVFLPGHSGLAIVHAFCYGRPFATIESEDHAPEIDYLKDGWNGLLLSGELVEAVDRLTDLLCHRHLLETYCSNAYETGERLSIESWCKQMADSFKPFIGIDRG